MTKEHEPKSYEREVRAEEDPIAPMPIAPNTFGGGGTVIVPPAVEDEEEKAEDVVNEIADPVKEQAHDLPPGQDFKERSQHNSFGEALVSEIQRESGIGGGSLPASDGTWQVGSGATAQSDGGRCTLFADPRSDAEHIASMDSGTQLLLLDGPDTAQGEPWWNVRLSDGRVGWVPQACLGPDAFPGTGADPEASA